jgi:hypothetical protein
MWHHKKTSKYNFQDIVEQIKHTLFEWNTEINNKLLLTHISYKFDININLIGVHKSVQKKKYYFYYIFQNTFIKLFPLGDQHFNPINLLYFKKKYYLLAPTNLYPFLINQTIQNSIEIENFPISTCIVRNILENQNIIDIPFNINIYTSYNFICQKSFTRLNFVGSYFKSKDCKTSNLFLSPDLQNNFKICHLPFSLTLSHNTTRNNYSLQHIIERKKIKLEKKLNKPEHVLNQESCVCDHPQTHRIFLPANKSFKSLTTINSQKYYLYENLFAFGILNNEYTKRLKLCSEISMISFDTEALNKNIYNNTVMDSLQNFENSFDEKLTKKTIYGIQQLYLIGITDILPKHEILLILKKYLPTSLFFKLKNYTNSNYKFLNSKISWNMFQTKLKKFNFNNCAKELLLLFQSKSIEEKDVKIFHISNNEDLEKSTEPSLEKTCQMTYHFLTYIYQRNVLASLVKYILLKPLIDHFDNLLLAETKGIFKSMKLRLNELIFEFILTAFNGSNYDNYLICNSLILIQSKLKEKIQIFKKGASISTIILHIKKNLQKQSNITKSSQLIKKVNCFWPMQIYIKDIRNLVASNLSLDKLGQLFNLNVSKLCFPYNKATSVKELKRLTSLFPYDEIFWKDTFSNKTVLLDDRIKAQELYVHKGFSNLYDYSVYYLKQDCLLLHNIVLTIFQTYLLENINLYIRRNFSQSSLSYQQFFIVEPSKQIAYINAPKTINNSFMNYFLKKAVTGGLCTSFVQGNINNTTTINEHFNYLENPNLNPNKWPSFSNCQPWQKTFNEKPNGINTIDIKSLYPSAAIKKIPVNTPLFYSRFTEKDFKNLENKNFTTYDLQSFCCNSQSEGSVYTDIFKLLNKAPRFYNEYYALKHYLNCLPKNIEILRFQSYFTALGQVYIGNYPVDGFLTYKEKNNSETLFVKIIQYNSNFYHGHKNTCSIKNNETDNKKFKHTNEIKNKILYLFSNFINQFELNHINFEYVEISDCDFFLHKVPKDKSFSLSYQKSYNYNMFLQKIYDKTLTGFILVKNLEIKKDSQNPIIGFIIQKVAYNIKNLSPYTQNQIKSFHTSNKVIAINKSKSFMVISTEYFNWLHKNFGFENIPEIYHALLFKTENYLRPSIEKKLMFRKTLKSLIKNEKDQRIKQNYEIQSELIKLMLNSCYGFTLCNLSSSKFKSYCIRNSFPSTLERQSRINSCIKLNSSTYLVENRAKQIFPFASLLGHVGCSILYNSKIILLKRLYFLLKYLNPRFAQLLYMDTDSAHFLVKHKNFRDNVDANLQPMFLKMFNKHFESGNKISGVWVEEGFYDIGEYIGEKCYKLFNKDSNIYITHMKGLNTFFQKKYVNENINLNELPYINYNIFFKSPDFIIYKSFAGKNLFSNYIPNKRYFINSHGSLPLKFD